jgi:hypothetical protein
MAHNLSLGICLERSFVNNCNLDKDLCDTGLVSMIRHFEQVCSTIDLKDKFTKWLLGILHHPGQQLVEIARQDRIKGRFLSDELK